MKLDKKFHDRSELYSVGVANFGLSIFYSRLHARTVFTPSRDYILKAISL